MTRISFPIFACAGAMLVLLAGPAVQRSAGQTAALNWPQVATELRPVLNGLGISIISTSRGVISDREARQRNLGGEVLCELW